MYEDQYGEFICGYWDLKVNEYLNKQEIQLDGCKLVGCYQKLPRPCTLVSHTWPFLSCFTTLFSVPNQVRKSPIFQGVGLWQVQHSTRQGGRGGGVPSVEGMDIFWNDTFELIMTETGQWLVNYSIFETPIVFYCYFILINRKFILQFTLKDHHIFSDASLSLRHTPSSTLIDQ